MSRLRSLGDRLAPDLVAGGVVAVVLVPQAMAYAVLAGLPPAAGLYAAIFPALVYAALGHSRHLAIGPTAVIALLTAGTVAGAVEQTAAGYAAAAATLALMVGAVQLAFGLLRGGFVANLLSHPVLTGFVTGAAVVIASTQLDELIGAPSATGGSAVAELTRLLGGAVLQAHPITAAVGVGSVVALLASRRTRLQRFAPLLVVGAASVASWALGLEARGVGLVGEIPRGLPMPALVPVDAALLAALAPGAVVIAFVGFAEGISLAKAFGVRQRLRVAPNRELAALGGANVVAGLFASFPVAGSFTRSAILYSAGARTRLAGAVAAVGVVVAVLTLAPALARIPQAALAAVVVVVAASLVDREEIARTLRLRNLETAVMVATFVTVVGVGVLEGLLLGIAAAVVVSLVRMATTRLIELGRMPGTAAFRDAGRFATLTDDSVAVVRLDAPLTYLNAGGFEEELGALVAERPALRAVVVDASAINALDATGADILQRMCEQMAASGTDLRLATVRGSVRDVLTSAGLWDRVGPHVHADVDEALAAAGFPPSHPLRAVEAHGDGGAATARRRP